MLSLIQMQLENKVPLKLKAFRFFLSQLYNSLLSAKGKLQFIPIILNDSLILYLSQVYLSAAASYSGVAIGKLNSCT